MLGTFGWRAEDKKREVVEVIAFCHPSWILTRAGGSLLPSVWWVLRLVSDLFAVRHKEVLKHISSHLKPATSSVDYEVHERDGWIKSATMHPL
jgi:hypothetical protein